MKGVWGFSFSSKSAAPRQKAVIALGGDAMTVVAYEQSGRGSLPRILKKMSAALPMNAAASDQRPPVTSLQALIDKIIRTPDWSLAQILIGATTQYNHEEIAGFSRQWPGIATNIVPIEQTYCRALRQSSDRRFASLLIDAGARETLVVRMGPEANLFARSFAASLPIENNRTPAGDWRAAWFEKLSEALDAGYRLGPLSGEVFLAGAGALNQEMPDAVRRGEWLRRFSHRDLPVLTILHGTHFFGGSSLGGFLAGPEDARLGALLAYATDTEYASFHS